MQLDRTTRPSSSGKRAQGLLLGYSGALAFVAGFVNAVALLLLAFPVGNLTAVTTQLGMNTANPLLYEGHILAAILLGFWFGAFIAGAILGHSHHLPGPRHAAVLTVEAILLILAALGVEETQVNALIESLGVEQTAVQALLAAAALGMQNGLTSSFRGMAIRTTHFTGTVTDLGLMLGRARRQGIEKWKAAVLSLTLVLFLGGGTAGLLIGTSLEGYALLVPAALCATIAAMSAWPFRGRTRFMTAWQAPRRVSQPAAVSA
ncbi:MULTISPECIES: YoaK family protein [unclassified Mycobacterium]|uniref:YoaK family protein n=1 Tax=unclassified Mycobacterium TaxID=2642494 RepID=UPI00274220D7|nr:MULTISPECIES: YoaK family protein [unclassified Mycobacterium]MDP7704408.1 YoaK family protein [Mycobacterium sp. TY815]MDP7722877.1 YoaK family protein [Mycobacterium sp. TY814]